MKTILTAILNALAALNPTVAAAFTVGTALVGAVAYMNTLWAQMFGYLDSIVVPAGSSLDFSPLELVNYVLPFDTFLTLLSAYVALVVVCATIRVVKAFIPTVS